MRCAEGEDPATSGGAGPRFVRGLVTGLASVAALTVVALIAGPPTKSPRRHAGIVRLAAPKNLGISEGACQ